MSGPHIAALFEIFIYSLGGNMQYLKPAHFVLHYDGLCLVVNMYNNLIFVDTINKYGSVEKIFNDLTLDEFVTLFM
jgi:hypothetical protein